VAQLTTDEVPRQRTVPARETVKNEVENRRWRIGPFRLNPILEISDLGYDSNVFGSSPGNEVADWTVSGRVGVQWIVPIGSKLYVVGEATPAYTWYRKLAERRTFEGTYRTSLLGFFNRASLEVGGYNTKSLTYVSAETATKSIETALDGTAKVEVDIASNLSVYGNVEAARLRYGLAGGDPTVIDVSQFQRQEAAARGGFRYRFSTSLDVSAGYEKTQTEFVNVGPQRDNQSDAYLFGIHFDRPRFFLSLSGGYREGKPYNGSTFARYTNSTGSFFASYSLNRLVELRGYGDRRIAYGLQAAQFVETSFGGGVGIQATPRVSLSLSAGTGTNAFPDSTSGGVTILAHTDRSNNYGAGLSALVYRQMVITLNASRSDYSSPDPTLNRKVYRYTSSIGFQGLFTR
jgi:hypothetical protein